MKIEEIIYERKIENYIKNDVLIEKDFETKEIIRV